MAATVEGAFIIRDRASNVLERIERKAQAADRAVNKLGRSLDMVATKGQIAQMTKADATMAKLGRDAESTTRTIEKQSRVLEGHRRQMQKNESAMERFGRKMILIFGGLGKVIGLMKIPALIVGIQQLIPAVAALGAGAAALLPKLTSLASVAAALPATFTGLGLAMATVKLSFQDISKAMGGNEDALKRLTPAARRFTETLKSWKPLVDSFRRSAQGGLFAGLDTGLERLRVAAPMVNRLLTMMGNRLGQLAAMAATRFTSRGFLRDFETLGNQGGLIVNRMGRGLLNLVDAIRHIAIAARPFTNWLTRTLYLWTRWIDSTARAGRETGRLQAWFRRSRSDLEQFGRIARNIWQILVGIGRAARPLGEWLYDAAERATKGWADFFRSVGGQVAARRFFDSTRDTLTQIFGLAGDVTKAFARMGANQAGGAQFVAGIRSLVPSLERILTALGNALGPPTIALLNTFARTIELLGQNAIGPLGIMLRLVNGILTVVNTLVGKVPALGTLIVAAFAVGPLLRAASAIRGIAVSWGLVTANAGRAAAAEALAAEAGLAGGIGGLGGRPGSSRMNPRIAAGATGAALTAEGILGAGRFGKLAGLGIRGAGKIALPLAIALGAMDAYGARRTGSFTNQVAQTGSAVLSGFSFGLIPQYLGADVERDNRLTQMATSMDPVRTGSRVTGSRLVPAGRFGGMRRVNTTTPTYTQSYASQAQDILSGPSKTAAQQAAIISRISALQMTAANQAGARGNKAIQGLVANLSQELQYRREILATTRAQEREADKARAKRAIGSIGQGFDALVGGSTDPKKQRTALGAMRREVLRQMGMLGPDGARELGKSTLKWLDEQDKANPKLKHSTNIMRQAILGEFDRLNINIRTVHGKILDGTKQKWDQIKKAMTSPAEVMKQDVTKAFTDVQNQALGSLQAMGYTAAQAKALVAGADASGHAPNLAGTNKTGSANTSPNTPGRHQRRAKGGRIPGSGLYDTVPLHGALAAPGELVVNRHTESRVDAALGQRGALDRMVRGESRPHHAPLPQKAGIMPGLATGGRVSADLNSTISQIAAQYGLDPAAWAAIMWHESRLNPSAIGDNGTSFGLTQLHIGGALGNISRAAAMRYLDPVANLTKAGSQMQAMGLSGLRGPAAISAYSRIFERPANPAAEIADALSWYRANAGGFSGGGVPTGGGGSALMRAIAAANAIDAHHYPYVWGGGHGRIGVPNGGYDCSGATSAVLGAAGLLSAPMVAASFMHWGTPGYDPHGLNVVASPSHVYMMLNGRAFGTSSANPGGGAGWFSGGIRPGFVVNHVKGAGAAAMMGALRAPRPSQGGLPGMAAGAAGQLYAGAMTGAINRQLAAGFAYGGRVPFAGWYGSGGTVTASRPTMIGIGDGPGTETAVISRSGSGGRGGAKLTIHIGTIVNHGGDVQREIEVALERMARKIEQMGVEDDQEVLV